VVIHKKVLFCSLSLLYDMSTIFTKIINGEIPCYKIFEDEFTFAFLDLKPHTLGHTLIVPKIEVDHVLDLPEPYYSRIFANAKIIGTAVQKATRCVRIGHIVLGFEVPHFHYHIIPLFEPGDIFPSNAHERDSEEMKEVQKKILANLN